MKFYKNKKTLEVVALLNGDLNDDFEEITLNENDASLEKHVPVYEIDGEELIVKVGELPHPMEENHYIMWIAIVHNNEFTLVNLKPSDNASYRFKYSPNSTIYAYCNLHGLWKKEVL